MNGTIGIKPQSRFWQTMACSIVSSSRFTVLAVCTILSARSLIAAPPEPKAINVKRWYAAIQKTGARFQQAATEAQTDLVRSNLIEQIAKEFDGSTIEFRARVKEVRWANDIAEVVTEREIPDSSKPNARQPLHVNRM